MPLIGAVIVFGVSLWDLSHTRETALIVLILLSLYLSFFNRAANPA